MLTLMKKGWAKFFPMTYLISFGYSVCSPFHHTDDDQVWCCQFTKINNICINSSSRLIVIIHKGSNLKNFKIDRKKISSQYKCIYCHQLGVLILLCKWVFLRHMSVTDLLPHPTNIEQNIRIKPISVNIG